MKTLTFLQGLLTSICFPEISVSNPTLSVQPTSRTCCSETEVKHLGDRIAAIDCYIPSIETQLEAILGTIRENSTIDDVQQFFHDSLIADSYVLDVLSSLRSFVALTHFHPTSLSHFCSNIPKIGGTEQNQSGSNPTHSFHIHDVVCRHIVNIAIYVTLVVDKMWSTCRNDILTWYQNPDGMNTLREKVKRMYQMYEIALSIKDSATCTGDIPWHPLLEGMSSEMSYSKIGELLMARIAILKYVYAVLKSLELHICDINPIQQRTCTHVTAQIHNKEFQLDESKNKLLSILAWEAAKILNCLNEENVTPHSFIFSALAVVHASLYCSRVLKDEYGFPRYGEALGFTRSSLIQQQLKHASTNADTPLTTLQESLMDYVRRLETEFARENVSYQQPVRCAPFDLWGGTRRTGADASETKKNARHVEQVTRWRTVWQSYLNDYLDSAQDCRTPVPSILQKYATCFDHLPILDHKKSIYRTLHTQTQRLRCRLDLLERLYADKFESANKEWLHWARKLREQLYTNCGEMNVQSSVVSSIEKYVSTVQCEVDALCQISSTCQSEFSHALAGGQLAPTIRTRLNEFEARSKEMAQALQQWKISWGSFVQTHPHVFDVLTCIVECDFKGYLLHAPCKEKNKSQHSIITYLSAHLESQDYLRTLINRLDFYLNLHCRGISHLSNIPSSIQDSETSCPWETRLQKDIDAVASHVQSYESLTNNQTDTFCSNAGILEDELIYFRKEFESLAEIRVRSEKHFHDTEAFLDKMRRFAQNVSRRIVHDHGFELDISGDQEEEVPVRSSLDYTSVQTPSRKNPSGSHSHSVEVDQARSSRKLFLSPSTKSTSEVQGHHMDDAHVYLKLNEPIHKHHVSTPEMKTKGTTSNSVAKGKRVRVSSLLLESMSAKKTRH